MTGTIWGQPTLSSPIGFEIHQAPRIYPPTCPWQYCVYADVAVGEYYAGVSRGYGYVYKTNFGSITITGTTSVVGNTYGALTGQTVHKVGRTTGTSSGTVLATCQDFPQVGGSAAVLCAQTANYNASGGDSGAPVWVPYNPSQPNTTPAVAGIHFGSAGSTRYFSPIGNIWDAQGYQFYW